jgi:hypothetical protein
MRRASLAEVLLAGVTFACSIYALPQPSEDEWVESDVDGRIALLDEHLSPLVPGVKFNSKEEAMALGTPKLDVKLETESKVVDLTETDDNFVVVFTVLNPTSKDLKILKRDTPLEGVRSKLFMIRDSQSKQMEYRGKDVKRSDKPGPDEYTTIKAGGSLKKTCKHWSQVPAQR